ncbi:voltage-dependent calcium channel type A subunit alpha-1 isoform X29 [Vespula squamosa]|uniref:Voltage-dependent calcium channel type A subunit alpha-1 isoform X29 n=1 Tax=Vespula squamosa TaxID=30214 RepID=A0ABD2B2Q8_VESSQ
MLGSVGGRHVSTRRRGSSPQVRGGAGLTFYGAGGPNNSNDATGGMPPDAPTYAARRRRAVTTSDYKSCALVQTRLKFGDITIRRHKSIWLGIAAAMYSYGEPYVRRPIDDEASPRFR